MVNTLRIFLLGVFLSVSLPVSVGSVFAQETKLDSLTMKSGNIKPELYGHSFISSTIVDGPFLNTYFKLSAGAGSSQNYDLPLVINGHEIQGLFGQVSYGAFDVRYQQRINDWLAFYVGSSVKGRLGSQSTSLLTSGINLGSNFGFGWMLKVYQSKKFLFTSALSIGSQSVTIYNLTEFIQKVIENGGITPDNKIVKTVNLTEGYLGLKSAYAFNRTFGVIDKFYFGYGESISGVNKGYFDAGILFDADLLPKYSVPIGFALGYEWNNYSQQDLDISTPQNILFRINYTGSRDFEVGVEMNYQFFTLKRLDQDINMKVLFARAGIAYYF